MLKLIYLAKRRPDFGFDDFIRRWRMHGARGMSTSFWRHALGYVQAEPIRPVPVAGISEEFDAIACLMVKEDTFTSQPLAEDAAEGEMMVKDELETFSRPIPEVSLWVREERLREGELGGVTAFLFFGDPASAREVAEHYRRDERLDRVILNRKREDGGLGLITNTLPYEAIVELSAGQLPALKAVLESDTAFRTSDVAVVTREAVLWDRMPVRSPATQSA